MKNAYELAENILKSKPDKNIELKSSDSFASIELYGTSACKKVQDTEFCECFHLENERYRMKNIIRSGLMIVQSWLVRKMRRQHMIS